MTPVSNVVAFPRNPGNGAREALIAIAETLPSTLESPNDALCWSDWLLCELWDRGFKIVPLEPSDA
jgi:hypothetical protein